MRAIISLPPDARLRRQNLTCKMNKTYATLSSLAITGMMLAGAASCDSNKQEAKPATAKAKSEKTMQTLPNYRYVDLDTILSRYNLAKDYNEEILRMQNNAESQMRQHQNKIQNFATTVQNKMQNNGYLSEASYNADMAVYNQKQQQAQNYLGSLQMKAQEEAARQQQVFLDSINSFLATYNKAHHYDAIIVYSPGDYFNPALDITQEIVDGLNAAYKKSAKTDKDAKADSTAVAKK